MPGVCRPAWPCPAQIGVGLLKTNRRNAQNRNTVPSSEPIRLPDTLSATIDSQPSTLRENHRHAIGMLNDARVTTA